MSIRTERVAGEIQKILSTLFQRDFSHLSDGLLTVTGVRMSPDLRSGKVYISIIGGKKGNENILRDIRVESPRLRSAVGKSMKLRFTPELFYYLDDTQEEVSRIEELFKKIRAERNENS